MKTGRLQLTCGEVIGKKCYTLACYEWLTLIKCLIVFAAVKIRIRVSNDEALMATSHSVRLISSFPTFSFPLCFLTHSRSLALPLASHLAHKASSTRRRTTNYHKFLTVLGWFSTCLVFQLLSLSLRQLLEFLAFLVLAEWQKGIFFLLCFLLSVRSDLSLPFRPILVFIDWLEINDTLTRKITWKPAERDVSLRQLLTRRIIIKKIESN